MARIKITTKEGVEFYGVYLHSVAEGEHAISITDGNGERTLFTLEEIGKIDVDGTMDPQVYPATHDQGWPHVTIPPPNPKPDTDALKAHEDEVARAKAVDDQARADRDAAEAEAQKVREAEAAAAAGSGTGPTDASDPGTGL